MSPTRIPLKSDDLSQAMHPFAFTYPSNPKAGFRLRISENSSLFLLPTYPRCHLRHLDPLDLTT